jgi:hypothetical protein
MDQTYYEREMLLTRCGRGRLDVVNLNVLFRTATANQQKPVTFSWYE